MSTCLNHTSGARCAHNVHCRPVLNQYLPRARARGTREIYDNYCSMCIVISVITGDILVLLTGINDELKIETDGARYGVCSLLTDYVCRSAC